MSVSGCGWKVSVTPTETECDRAAWSATSVLPCAVVMKSHQQRLEDVMQIIPSNQATKPTLHNVLWDYVPLRNDKDFIAGNLRTSLNSYGEGNSPHK